MKNIYKLLLPVFLILSINISAQIYPVRYSDFSVVIKADSCARSVLLSNVLENQLGNHSPIIGTAGWTENGKELQCRSLLAFDYSTLPELIKPEDIVKAQLILVPLAIENFGSNESEVSKINVRRVTEPWEETKTNWLNQPLTNDKDEVTTRMSPKKKEKVISIDVTRQVKNMFRYGNNGFMIRFKDSLSQAASYSHWFASAKNTNEDLRPVLIITCGIEIPLPFTTSNWAVSPDPQQYRIDMAKQTLTPTPQTTIPLQTETPMKEPVKD